MALRELRASDVQWLAERVEMGVPSSIMEGPANNCTRLRAAAAAAAAGPWLKQVRYSMLCAPKAPTKGSLSNNESTTLLLTN